MSAEHRSKVTRLMGYRGRGPVTLRQWVEHLVKDPTVEGSAAAVKLVAALIGRLPDQRHELTRARVLLLDDGSVDGCRRGQVFLPGGGEQNGRLTIDPVLAADPGVVSALGSLGIEIFDSAGELRSELTQDRSAGSACGAPRGRTRSTRPRRSSEMCSVTGVRPSARAHVLGEVEGARGRLPGGGGHPGRRIAGRGLPRRSAVPSAGQGPADASWTRLDTAPTRFAAHGAVARCAAG